MSFSYTECVTPTEVSVQEKKSPLCFSSARCLLFLHRNNGAHPRQRGSAEHAGHHHRCSHTSHQPIRMSGSAAVETSGPAAPSALPHQAHEVKFLLFCALLCFYHIKSLLIPTCSADSRATVIHSEHSRWFELK